MKKMLKSVVLFLALMVILGCQKKEGAFEKMGHEMDKTATKMNKALQDIGSE